MMRETWMLSGAGGCTHRLSHRRRKDAITCLSLRLTARQRRVFFGVGTAIDDGVCVYLPFSTFIAFLLTGRLLCPYLFPGILKKDVSQPD